MAVRMVRTATGGVQAVDTVTGMPVGGTAPVSGPTTGSSLYGASMAVNPNYTTPTNAVNDPTLSAGYNQALNYMGVSDPTAYFKSIGADANGNPMVGGPNNGLAGRTTAVGQLANTNTAQNSFANNPGAYAGSDQSANPGSNIPPPNILAVMAAIPGQAGQWAQQQLAASGQTGLLQTAQNDPVMSSAMNQLMYGKDPATVLAGLSGFNGGAGNVTLPMLQQMAAAIQQSGAVTGATAYGGSGQNPGTSTPVTGTTNTNPTAAAGNGMDIATQNQIRQNYMDSPTYNPGGANTYAIQNTDINNLQAGMAPSGQSSQAYNATGAYNPTPQPGNAPVADGGVNSAFGGNVGAFNATANSNPTGQVSTNSPIGASAASVTPPPAQSAVPAQTTQPSYFGGAVPAPAMNQPSATAGGFNGANSVDASGQTAAQRFQAQQQNG